MLSCQKSYQKKISNDKNTDVEDFFIDVNKKIFQDEELRIDSLVKQSGIQFVNDSTGIRYVLDESINSTDIVVFPENGNLVTVAYSCFVFDDINRLYNDSFEDTLTFKIGFSKQMRGFNYAIKLLQIGDNAKIIIPSYLGFGMSGYANTVPPYSTILLNVKLLNIQ